MKKLIIKRTYWPLLTQGEASVWADGYELFKFKSLELVWNDNKRAISCIPEGEYNVKRIISPTFGRCFNVQNVPGRSAILIHSGNYAAGKKKDTRGCILVGHGFADINNDGNMDVVGSKETMFRLNTIMPNEFILKII